KPDNTAHRVIHTHDQQKLKLAGFTVDRTHYRHQSRWQTSLRKREEELRRKEQEETERRRAEQLRRNDNAVMDSGVLKAVVTG
ncbi:hypothetical protein ACSLOF_26460, partial [Escherichia coli]|uniref:hypothetical protein n=1 Tax=Escherichia coli TaxID=562 RepID=UPI003EE3AA3B